MCPNGVVEAGEQCDDNNANAGDGCSVACLTEVCEDPDGDGLGLGCLGGPDCAPLDPRTLTNEVCDGFDNDCDGDVDEDGVCGCDVIQIGDRFALLCFEQLRFDDAVAFCAARPGYALLSIRNAAEEADSRAVAGFPDLWLALTDRALEGTFRNLSGGAPSFTAFAANQPNNFNNQDCLVSGPGGWNDVDCVEQLFAVACERVAPPNNVCSDDDGDGFGAGCPRGPDCDDNDPGIAVLATDIVDADLDGALGTAIFSCVAPLPAPPLPTAPARRPDCDDADANHALACFCDAFNGEFSLCLEQYPYDVWIDGCAERGSMGVARNAGDARDLEDAVQQRALTSAWINGTDVVLEGSFVLNEGGSLPFVDFAAGEPNDFGTGEDCLQMLPEGVNDAACSSNRPAFCQP